MPNTYHMNRQYEVSDCSIYFATNISTRTLVNSFIKIDERKRVLKSVQIEKMFVLYRKETAGFNLSLLSRQNDLDSSSYEYMMMLLIHSKRIVNMGTSK